MSMNRSSDKLALAAFRLPPWLKEMADRKCNHEDLTFSQLMRRAIRKDLGLLTADYAEIVRQASKSQPES